MKRKNMTRKAAIEIVVETIKKCSWVPKGWKYAAAAEPGALNEAPKKGRVKACGVGFWVDPAKGDPTYGHGYEKSHHGDKGWYFSRKWLEKNGYLK